MERELLLLGLLRREGMHGYKLIEFIERDLALCTDLKKPTAYFLLDKMVQSGWITYIEEQEGNRPQRRTYQITEKGEERFQVLLRQVLSNFTSLKFVGDVGLAFADALPTEELLALFRQQRDGLTAELDTLKNTPPHGGWIQVMIDHRIFHLESEQRWLDQLIERLGSNQQP